MFCLNQISVHDNQLMLKWYSTGYIAVHIHCTILHSRTLYTFPYSPSFLLFIKFETKCQTYVLDALIQVLFCNFYCGKICQSVCYLFP